MQALTVSHASELSIAFRVLMKHVCLLTTYSQVISITCKCNCSIHFLPESTSRVECESCMQANLVKSLYLAFCYCNLFLQSLFNNFCNCYYFIVFNGLHCALISTFINHMYVLLVRYSMKLTDLKVNNIYTFVHWLNGNVIH